ncbi:sensor histidine kinase [Methanocella arvoryzae]|uniref:sensor histidine kinase n=1 Tax=Methanocella arvoryzae TaxID=1175445 RepID=UPI0022B21EEF|nr:sensor histidine kinase [Methanocella arvoryzae]
MYSGHGLKNENNFYRVIFETAHEPMLIIRPDGRIVEVNNSLIKAFGYAKEELLRMNLADLLPIYGKPDMSGHLEKCRQGQVFEAAYRRRDGSVFPAEVSAQRAVLGDEMAFIEIIRDITDRKQAEEAMNRLRAILEKSQEIAGLGNWELDLTTNQLTWSDEVYRIFGLQPQEFGATYEAFLRFVHPDDRAAVDEAYTRSVRLGKNSYSIEHRIVRKTDGQVRIVHEKCEHYRDSSGKIIRSIGIVQDITERKQAEEELKAAKAQAELYLDLMSHDISNMHHIILMQLELALSVLDEEGKLDVRKKDMLDIPFRTLKRSVNLIHNVRTLQKVRSGEYKAEPLDLCPIIEEIINVYSDIPGRDVTIRYTPATGQRVMVSPLIKDVISNLVDNAVKHVHDPVMIDIDVARVERNGVNYYRISVVDNGDGIPDEKKELIFQRFKRGQTKAKGTGLGLYIVKTLVESFGGLIEVTDRVPGDHRKGARFNVYLPVAGA